MSDFNLPPGCSVRDIENAQETHVVDSGPVSEDPEEATPTANAIITAASYAWYCSGYPVPANKADWVTNGLRFATKEESDAWGDDLGFRWTAMGEGETRPTTDPVNYRWNFETRQAERLEDAP